MERGLMWLPLLALFIGLAWAGWNEFQKVEAYRRWAEGSDRAKYDIYAMLCQRGAKLSWGKPSRQGPQAVQSCSLNQIQDLILQIDQQRWTGSEVLTLEADQLASGRTITLTLTLTVIPPPNPVATEPTPQTANQTVTHTAIENAIESVTETTPVKSIHHSAHIPFTDPTLALQWAQWLQADLTQVS